MFGLFGKKKNKIEDNDKYDPDKVTVHYEGALTKIQADQILSNFVGKAKVTEKIFLF